MQTQSRMLIDRIRDTLLNDHKPREVSIGVDRSLFMRASDRAMIVSREVGRGLESIGIDHKSIAVVPQIDGCIAYSVIVYEPRRTST